MEDVKVELHEVVYHRNGVGGAPFRLVRFTFSELGVREVDLLAVVYTIATWVEARDSGREDEAFTAVIDPTNMHSKWRGDRLHDHIVLAIRATMDPAEVTEEVEGA